ncbi:Glycosyl hydrolases family 31 protein [Trichomonas vaginalis G3]|uniref:Glycosyl hydrolases family 31 protein n=1 Tax=Trichomonas vaginalis (strain ATCC PRA-98 / G3) TaxID=412133 RepID=A2FY09_TRIV3|nr:glycosyl hydrolase [Trichomonas vaginalis G3]EAX90208.1 Glycosyl hydrolases family 31 protein [Trichomonas vaginalis G3]KAI5492471.1 alpha-1,3-glucosidase protein [Trichomonas vaginalis G3]|eukprot:XP_001303138.1 glycosyl hydrolase [Trichomonas vaginalis G3]
MNEIAVFQRIEGTNHKDWQHMHNTIESRETHNSYGLFMTAGTYKGLLQRDNNKRRPFILTRSFFAGSQKYTWHWSGVNDASWEHLRLSIDILITANLNGCPYTGSDIGGFTGNTTDQLHGRWFQAAAFLYPFYRQHAAINCEYREPYLFKGTQLFDIMKKVTEQRYKLIPLWYAAAYKHTTSSSPLVAPLWYYYPEVENLHDVRFQAIVGESLMACPVVYQNMDSLLIVKPPGKWYSFENGEELTETKNIYVNFDSIPVYLRGGYITPSFVNSKMNVKEQMKEDLLLHIALDENLTAKGYIYFDDGESFDYLHGGFVLAEVNFTDGKLSVRPSRSTNYTKTIKSLKIYGLPESEKLHTGGDIKREGNVVTVSNLNIEINKESTTSSSKKKVGLIVGIVIAVIVVVAAVCFAVYWFVFRDKSQEHEKFEESPMNV